MKIALLISTYNWPKALKLVLKSAAKQSLMPDEILIADDGSKNKTKSIITKYQKKYNLPLKHIWHEDKGFRRTVILNKALAATNADYIVQLDGDCIMHHNFVRDHVQHAKKNRFLFGSRVNLKESCLEEIFKNKETEFDFFDQRITKRTRNLHIDFLAKLYKESPELSSKVRGCNISYWREDFLKVNGYNEDMTGWGKEDSEFVIRLLNNNIYGKRMRYNAIVYHIWHKNACRAKEVVNTKIQAESIENRSKRCENGVSKYLENATPSSIPK
ncbi:glycosyltransferase family 2 protein [Zunongwangia sp. HGR-M22]|uniref:glycosyltransferase family 2 protein n=1 Tax=Zunongwangia sp. HGR-M22 TaxID=3015168 RepID=UPI0022DDD269|nr:glycosyltransferase family 2 protein [Zunongwangia sp. HGR-M22]WBL26637.1 glycosyltransferase family 2 protein [Zunongwangia sp. HGR-M22]